MKLVLAPGGWGYAPGTPLGPVSPAMLPALQRGSLQSTQQYTKAITEALKAFPRLRDLTPRTVVERYGISITAASDAIQRASGRWTRSKAI